MTEPEQQYLIGLLPTSTWGWLYLIWFLICFFMVLVGTWFVNRPVSVGGLPLVYAWCTGWGIVWLVGCLICGLQIEREQEQGE